MKIGAYIVSSSQYHRSNESQIYPRWYYRRFVTINNMTDTYVSATWEMHYWCMKYVLTTQVTDITVNDFGRTGIFTLTSDRGLPEIGQCRERGFHQHTKTPPLFDVSPGKTSSFYKVLCIFEFCFSYVWLDKHFNVYCYHEIDASFQVH